MINYLEESPKFIDIIERVNGEKYSLFIAYILETNLK